MKQITLFLCAFLFFSECKWIMAQQVTVISNSEQNTLTINNNSEQEIILFSNDVQNDDEDVFELNSFKKNVKPCGLVFSNYYIVIRHEHSHTFENVNPYPIQIVFFEYQIIDDKYVLTNRKTILAKNFREYNDEVNIVSTNPSADTVVLKQPSKNTEQEVKPAEPKKNKPASQPLINPYSKQIEALFNDSRDIISKGKGGLLLNEEENLRAIEKKAVALRESIANEKIAIEKKKANKKENCNDCDLYINFSKESLNQLDVLIGKIHVLLASMTEQQIAELITMYWNEVLTTAPQDTITLQFIKEEIERRNKHYFWGWIGKSKIMRKLEEVSVNYEQIKEKSTLFIQQKLQYYNDVDDRVVILDLENEIPINFLVIGEYENELNNIKIPYVKLSLIGVVFLLLITGLAVYIRSFFIRNRIKKIEIENRISGKTGLLIEEDDSYEAIVYRIGLDDIKEKFMEDYYAIQMADIFEDTSIEKVYLSREAILSIYKFFTDFLNNNGKTNETGCFLVGRWDYVPNSNNLRYDISIETIVEPSDDAVYGEYTLNFGAKIGITLNYDIEKLCIQTDNEYVHTAWIHSHPGLGLFLSSQDLSVQSQLAHSQHQGRMLAIVLDTNTPDLKMALFTPKQNGTMNNDKDVKQFLSLEELFQWAQEISI
ncbi:MAG: hypothetical protein LBU83_03925 [Bacteroidales bacterium]|jgi:hypothetical protein|nr:hypothetical protein [Bacteroidales bacterium]